MEDAAGEDAPVGTARRSGDDGDGGGNGEETEVLDSNAQDEKLVDSEDEEKEGGAEEDEEFGEAQDNEDLDSDEELDDSEEEDEESDAEEDEEFGEAQDSQVLDSDEELDDSEEEEEEGGAEEEFGEAQDPAWFQVHRLGPDEEELLLVTPPSQGSAEEDLGVLEEFFQQMDQFERQPVRVSSVRVTINEPRTLPLCSSLVCSLLRRHRFSARFDGVLLRFDWTGDGDRTACGDDTVFSLVASFLENKTGGERQMRRIVATVVPTRQEQVDRLFRVALNRPWASLILRDTGEERVSLLKETTDLSISSGQASIVVQSPSLDEAAMRSVLTAHWQPPNSSYTVRLTSSALRAAEVALAGHSEPACRNFYFFSNKDGLDASALCGALFRCRNLKSLGFYYFTFAAGVAMPEGENAGGDTCANEVLGISSLAPLGSLTFKGCKIATVAMTERPIKQLTMDQCTRGVTNGVNFGPCELAVYLSRTCSVQNLTITKCLVEMRDMKLLCNALTHAKCTVEALALHPEPATRDDAVVYYFFERLPRMKSLRDLSFTGFNAPTTDLAPTVLVGLERNYSLRYVRCFPLKSDDLKADHRLMREIDAYTAANRRGRLVVARAAMDPNSAALRTAALDAIHRLANSDDSDDFVSLLLCLRLFVPAFAWGASSGAGGGGGRPPVARRRSGPDE
jgi:hypothetical protein